MQPGGPGDSDIAIAYIEGIVVYSSAARDYIPARALGCGPGGTLPSGHARPRRRYSSCHSGGWLAAGSRRGAADAGGTAGAITVSGNDPASRGTYGPRTQAYQVTSTKAQSQCSVPRPGSWVKFSVT